MQALFEWQESHLHLFIIDGVQYDLPDLVEWDPPGPEWCEMALANGADPVEVAMMCAPSRDERKVRLGDLARRGIREFDYLYDFGDHWEHRVEIEAVEEVDVGRLPALLGGARSGPLEDCGGVHGYDLLQRAFVGEPVEEWGQELAEWARMNMGPWWSPDRINEELIEDRLSRTWRGPRR
jgi:hypothetical protein